MSIFDAIIRETPFALYITDNRAHVLQLQGDLKSPKIESFAAKELAPGLVQDGRVIKKPELGKEIAGLLAAAKPIPIKNKKCVLVLPENTTFEYAFYFNKTLTGDEISRKLLESIEGTVPLAAGDIRYNQASFDLKLTKVVFASAVEKQYINEYRQMLKIYCDLEPLVIEPALLSLIRNIPVNLSEDAGNVLIRERDGMVHWSIVWHGNVFDSNHVPMDEFPDDLKISISHFEEESKRGVKNIFLTETEDSGRLIPTLQESCQLPLIATDKFRICKPSDPIELKILGGAALRGLMDDNNEINLA